MIVRVQTIAVIPSAIIRIRRILRSSGAGPPANFHSVQMILMIGRRKDNFLGEFGLVNWST